jgi:hypothetical protein
LEGLLGDLVCWVIRQVDRKTFRQRAESRARIQGFADRSEGGKKKEVSSLFLRVH